MTTTGSYRWGSGRADARQLRQAVAIESEYSLRRAPKPTGTQDGGDVIRAVHGAGSSVMPTGYLGNPIETRTTCAPGVRMDPVG